jgi:hypothetical protein
MLRVGRLRDAKWQRPAGVRGADEKPRIMSFTDAVQIASALWVKEAGGVARPQIPHVRRLEFCRGQTRRASLAVAPSGLRRRCAGQFGCDGGREVGACPAFSAGALNSKNGVSRTGAERRFVKDRHGIRREPLAGKQPPDNVISGEGPGPERSSALASRSSSRI